MNANAASDIMRAVNAGEAFRVRDSLNREIRFEPDPDGRGWGVEIDYTDRDERFEGSFVSVEAQEGVHRPYDTDIYMVHTTGVRMRLICQITEICILGARR